MLILTRKKGQRIVIEYGSGETAVIEIQKAKPNSIKIAIDAPQQLDIHRAERNKSFLRLLRIITKPYTKIKTKFFKLGRNV